MSGSETMSKDIAISDFYELVSDVKVEFVNSDFIREIIPGGPHEEQEPHHEVDSDSKVEPEEFNRETFQNETPSIEEIDIKYEMVSDIEHNSTSHGEVDLDTDAILSKINAKPKNHASTSEEKELNQLYLDLLQCERDCLMCQKYIRELSEHVKATHHRAGQPTSDPLHIDPSDMDQSSAIEIKCEYDGDIGRVECCEESDSISELEIESDRESDPDYNASTDLTRKRKSGQKKDHHRDKRSRNKIHMREKPFKCEVCDMCFTSERTFCIHFKIHTGKKPFKCEKCGNSFTRRHDLTVHMRIHTQEKPYNCAQCAKSFTTKSHLTSHLRTHTGKKPLMKFMCDVCGKNWRSMSSLNVHMMVHTGHKPYKCETCDKSFRKKCEVIIHRRRHTGEKPFICGQCPRSFTSRRNLTKHLRNHSGETVRL